MDENENDDRARSVIASFASLSGQSRHRPVASHRHTASHRPSHPSIPRGRGRAAPLAHRFSRELGELLERGGGFGGHDSRSFVRSFVVRRSSFVRSFVDGRRVAHCGRSSDVIVRGHPRARGAKARREAAARAVAGTVEIARASDSRGGERDEMRASEMRREMRGSVRGATRRAVTRRGRRR